jgi:hypothetical protein
VRGAGRDTDDTPQAAAVSALNVVPCGRFMNLPVHKRCVCTTEQPPRRAWQYDRRRSEKETIVLSTILIVLLALWLVGLVTSYTFGGFIHLLLVVAIVVVLLRVIQGRNLIHG